MTVPHIGSGCYDERRSDIKSSCTFRRLAANKTTSTVPTTVKAAMAAKSDAVKAKNRAFLIG